MPPQGNAECGTEDSKMIQKDDEDNESGRNAPHLKEVVAANSACNKDAEGFTSGGICYALKARTQHIHGVLEELPTPVIPMDIANLPSYSMVPILHCKPLPLDIYTNNRCLVIPSILSPSLES